MNIIFTFFFIILFGLSSTAQDELKKYDFAKNNQRSSSMSFDFINNLVILPVIINQSDTLNFILDTGLTTAMITELTYYDTVDLRFAKDVELKGLGIGEPLDALHSYGNTIQIGNIIGHNQDIYILRENIFLLSAKLGKPVHGILGYSIFKDFIISINYNRRRIKFYNPEKFEYRNHHERRFSRLPILIHDTKPYFQIQIEDEKGKRYDVKLLLDTGASHAIWLDVNSIPGLEIPKKSKYTFLGTGLNGKVFGELGRVSHVIINDHSLEDVIVSFPDSNSIVHAAGLDMRNGSLGAEILRRFNVIFDYPNQQIWLKPNSMFSDNFTQNYSGMEVITPFPRINYYVVDDVRGDSPAGRAGLRKGDEILEINHIEIQKLSLSEIYHILQSKPGRKVSIEYKRGNEIHAASFELEEYI